MPDDSWESVGVTPLIGGALAVEPVLSAVPVAICLADLSGQLIHANARAVELFGARLNTPGAPVHDLLGHAAVPPGGEPARCTDPGCQVREALSARTGARFDREAFLHGDGSLVHFDWISAPWTLAEPGPPAATVIVLRDVTERARREDLLAQQQVHRLELINRELDQFAYVASHDLKAPLRGIANLAQWIEEDMQDSLRESTRDMLALMRSRMHRMEALIDGLLQLSRAGRLHQQPETLDAAELLQDVIELLAPPDTTAILVSPDLPRLRTERLPLQQVFLNLLSNAVKYTQRPDARVFVDARDAGDEIEFTVRDNGPGIAPEFHDKVWAIFQTLQSRDKVEGTGIGLALVKKIVESRGGVVWVESQAGEGATFGFTWPKHATEAGE